MHQEISNVSELLLRHVPQFCTYWKGSTVDNWDGYLDTKYDTVSNYILYPLYSTLGYIPTKPEDYIWLVDTQGRDLRIVKH